MRWAVRALAKQVRIGEGGKDKVLPIILHGDAAFAGQGVTAESLNMASLGGYNIGGTLHIITNNLLGFTALPEESNSTRFSTDLAKRLPIPIFHLSTPKIPTPRCALQRLRWSTVSASTAM